MAMPSAAHDIRRALGTFLRVLDEVYEGFARQQNLHSTDLRCLLFLDSQPGPVSAKDIAAELNLTSGSATALLDRLQRHRLIRRLPNPKDRRGVLVEIDPDTAEDTLPKLRRLTGYIDAATLTLSSEEAGRITHFLDTLSQSASAFLAEWRAQSKENGS